MRLPNVPGGHSRSALSEASTTCPSPACMQSPPLAGTKPPTQLVESSLLAPLPLQLGAAAALLPLLQLGARPSGSCLMRAPLALLLVDTHTRRPALAIAAAKGPFKATPAPPSASKAYAGKTKRRPSDVTASSG